MSILVTLLTNKYVIIGLIVVTACVSAYLYIWHSATAAAATAALVLAAQRTAAAQRARSEVKANDQAAMDQDKFNRDRPGR